MILYETEIKIHKWLLKLPYLVIYNNNIDDSGRYPGWTTVVIFALERVFLDSR